MVRWDEMKVDNEICLGPQEKPRAVALGRDEPESGPVPGEYHDLPRTDRAGLLAGWVDGWVSFCIASTWTVIGFRGTTEYPYTHARVQGTRKGANGLKM